MFSHPSFADLIFLPAGTLLHAIYSPCIFNLNFVFMGKELKELRLAGISAALPPGVSPDGECCDLVNMRNENGVWHVSGSPRKLIESDSSRMQLTMVHSNMGYKHIICYDGKSVFWEADMSGGGVKGIGKKIADIENVKSLAQNGNFIVAVTGCECRYLLFTDNDYIYLGGLHMPELMFNLKYEGDIKYENKLFFFPERVYKDDLALSTNNNTYLTGVIKALIDQAKSDFRNDNCFLHPFLVRYAIRLFDGSHIFPSPAILMMPINNYVIGYYEALLNYSDNNTYGSLLLGLDKYSLQFSCCNIPFGEWDEIIDGVDVFISDQKSFLRDSSTFTYWLETAGTDGDNFSKNIYFGYDFLTQEERIAWVREESLFFKIASYSLAELREMEENNGGAAVNIRIDTRLEQLVQQEHLEVDNFTFFDNGADTSFIYNSHLHLGGIYQYFPKPFPLYIYGIRQALFGGNTGDTVPGGCSCFIDVTLKCNDGLKKVSSEVNVPAGFMLSPFISYPDSRATEMEIRMIRDGKERCIHLPLVASDMENSAIYVNESLKPLAFGAETESSYVFEEKRAYEYFPNRIKVSETDNVLFFPQEQTYTVSEGKILKLAAATKEVSQGQYGEYPLYVFTDEGIWAMQQGEGDILYASQHPVNRDVPLSGNVICGIDNAVAYISEHGLTVLSGSESRVISNSHDGRMEEFDEVQVEGEDFDAVCNSDIAINFKSYLSGSSAGYDYVNNELLFLLGGESYYYAYNMASDTWGRRIIGHSPLKSFINVYPNIWICDEAGSVFNLSDEDEDQVRPFAFISRSIKGFPYCSKQLNGAVLTIGNFSAPGCSLHLEISASELPDSGFRNILAANIPASQRDTLRFPVHTRPFKFFRLTVYGNGNRMCCFNNICMELTPKYTGKLR